jgi:hypothetical protein
VTSKFSVFNCLVFFLQVLNTFILQFDTPSIYSTLSIITLMIFDENETKTFTCVASKATLDRRTWNLNIGGVDISIQISIAPYSTITTTRNLWTLNTDLFLLLKDNTDKLLFFWLIKLFKKKCWYCTKCCVQYRLEEKYVHSLQQYLLSLKYFSKCISFYWFPWVSA